MRLTIDVSEETLARSVKSAAEGELGSSLQYGGGRELVKAAVKDWLLQQYLVRMIAEIAPEVLRETIAEVIRREAKKAARDALSKNAPLNLL